MSAGCRLDGNCEWCRKGGLVGVGMLELLGDLREGLSRAEERVIVGGMPCWSSLFTDAIDPQSKSKKDHSEFSEVSVCCIIALPLRQSKCE